jgi:hypothetical protein
MWFRRFPRDRRYGLQQRVGARGACLTVGRRRRSRNQDATDDAYRDMLGYQRGADGTRETTERYTERMCALVALQSAIAGVDVPGAHPHGVDRAWTWLARALNCPPEPILLDLISTTLKVRCMGAAHCTWSHARV